MNNFFKHFLTTVNFTQKNLKNNGKKNKEEKLQNLFFRIKKYTKCSLLFIPIKQLRLKSVKKSDKNRFKRKNFVFFMKLRKIEKIVF